MIKLLGGTEMGAFKSKIDVDTVTEIAQMKPQTLG